MNKTNLSAYMAMTVSQLKEEQRMGTAHVYQSTLNRIKDFMEQNSISFEEVTGQRISPVGKLSFKRIA